jgi:hypothetical protein
VKKGSQNKMGWEKMNSDYLFISVDKLEDREVVLEIERRQAVAAFSTRYMGFRWSEVESFKS